MITFDQVINSKPIERFKRALAKRTGFYLRLKRLTASASEELRTAMLLQHFNIDLVLDIGANTGQFAESLFDFGYAGRVISFEPGKEAHKVLQKRQMGHSNWMVFRRIAIGETNGELMLNVSHNTVFSSFLKITDKYALKKKGAGVEYQEMVEVVSLDSISNELDIQSYKNILLKIDTQGFERQVLAGAIELVKLVKGIKIEIPLHPIYHDVDYTFYQIIEYLKDHGFEPYSFNVEGVDLQVGRVNTIDGSFFRES